MDESRLSFTSTTCSKGHLRVLVIIPAYNEQECILNTVAAIKAAGYDYVVINDGSQDTTLELCREHGINILDLPQNLGIGGAVQAGHKYAQRFGYDIDIQVDGDGQHDPSYIPELVKLIESGASLAIGSRFLVETDGFQSTLCVVLESGGFHFCSSCLRVRWSPIPLLALGPAIKMLSTCSARVILMTTRSQSRLLWL